MRTQIALKATAANCYAVQPRVYDATDWRQSFYRLRSRARLFRQAGGQAMAFRFKGCWFDAITLAPVMPVAKTELLA